MLGVLLIMDNVSFPQLRMSSLLSLPSLEILYLTPSYVSFMDGRTGGGGGKKKKPSGEVSILSLKVMVQKWHLPFK